MNQAYENIISRYSCRDFEEKEVSDELLKLIGEAAVSAPSAMDRQPWHVHVVSNKALVNEIHDEALKIAFQNEGMKERIESRGGTLFYHAPVIVFISKQVGSTEASGLLDLGIIAQNVSLAANSLGLGSLHCGMARLAFTPDKEQEFLSRIGVPEGYVYGTAVLIGYPKMQGVTRTPNSEKVSYIK